jgi:hypothetical protein
VPACSRIEAPPHVAFRIAMRRKLLVKDDVRYFRIKSERGVFWLFEKH